MHIGYNGKQCPSHRISLQRDYKQALASATISVTQASARFLIYHHFAIH